MEDSSLNRLLEQMLSDSIRAQRRFAAEQAHYRRVAARQKVQLAVGRLKFDAARAAPDQCMAERASGKDPL